MFPEIIIGPADVHRLSGPARGSGPARTRPMTTLPKAVSISVPLQYLNLMIAGLGAAVGDHQGCPWRVDSELGRPINVVQKLTVISDADQRDRHA